MPWRGQRFFRRVQQNNIISRAAIAAQRAGARNERLRSIFRAVVATEGITVAAEASQVLKVKIGQPRGIPGGGGVVRTRQG